MFQNIENAQFKKLMKEPNTLIFDVRTPKEVSEGYIVGTKEFSDINNAEEFEQTLKRLDKTKNYLVYCRSGARSAKACKVMEERGFKGKLFNLAMGITGWDGEKK
jgi:rhodanese-related sulfurtransferase